jgi:hypothetical protein
LGGSKLGIGGGDFSVWEVILQWGISLLAPGFTAFQISATPEMGNITTNSIITKGLWDQRNSFTPQLRIFCVEL